MAEEQPHWSPFEAAEDWTWFRTEVDGILGRMGLEHRWREGFIEVDVDGWPHTLGILTVGRELLERVPDRDTWPAELDRRVRDALVALGERDAVPAYAVASQQLHFRLRPLAEVPRSHVLVAERFADDLLSVVVLDDGRRVRSIDSAHVEGWGMTVDEVAATARRNTTEVGDLQREVFTHASGAEALVLSTPGSTYGASQAIFPDAHLGPVGEHGALVAVPNRQICLLHKVVDARAADVLQWARPWVDARATAAGRISADFYWWRGAGDAVRLPDERFDAVLASLPR